VSRAFVKEDTEEAPVVPRRAPLPEGVRNYVTPRGLELLRSELEALVAELKAQTESVVLHARIAELEARITSAEPVDPAQGPADVVHFGTRVTIRSADETEHTYRIVGVDEANAAEGSVAFVAPLARALLGKHVGEVAIVRTPRGEQELEVLAIDVSSEA
jgi:transcription elongation factor GreB